MANPPNPTSGSDCSTRRWYSVGRSNRPSRPQYSIGHVSRPALLTEVSSHVRRYWHTLRYLRAAQIAARVDLRARSALRGVAPAATRRRYSALARRAALDYTPDPWRLRGTASAARESVAPTEVASVEREAADLARGVFTFLNDRRELGQPVAWTAPRVPQLWRYHLHYFDCLPDLLIANVPRIGLDLMTDWVRRVPMGEAATRDAWHPYVVSLRIVNWM